MLGASSCCESLARAAAHSDQVLGFENTLDPREVVVGADQQRRARTSNDNEELYYYDSAGSRYLAVERSPAASVVRSRVWFGGTEYWFSGSGTIDKRMTNLTLGGLSVARIDSKQLEFSFHNGLGHLMATVESNAEMSTGFVYGPFGEILSESGDVETHFRRFNGKEADLLSRLNYYGYRYYDPLSLTWTQADPLFRIVPDLAYDQPRLMSLYAFSLNNPVRYMDPDGRRPDTSGMFVQHLETTGEALTLSEVSEREGAPSELEQFLIDTIALLHQYQREVKSVTVGGQIIEYVEVTRNDVEVANRLSKQLLGRSLDELPPQTRTLLGLIEGLAKQLAAPTSARGYRLGQYATQGASGAAS